MDIGIEKMKIQESLWISWGGCLCVLPDITSFLLFLRFQFCLIFVAVLGFGQCKIQGSSWHSLPPQQKMKSTWWIRGKWLLSSLRKSWFYAICWLKHSFDCSSPSCKSGWRQQNRGCLSWRPWLMTFSGTLTRSARGSRGSTGTWLTSWNEWALPCWPGNLGNGVVLNVWVTSSLVLGCKNWEPAVCLLWSWICCITLVSISYWVLRKSLPFFAGKFQRL